MSDRDEISRRPKLNTDEGEEDFDWKQEVSDSEKESYAIYLNKNIEAESIAKLSEYDFKWNGHYWERIGFLDRDFIKELEQEGFVVEKT